jgi:hypothetical protein
MTPLCYEMSRCRFEGIRGSLPELVPPAGQLRFWGRAVARLSSYDWTLSCRLIQISARSAHLATFKRSEWK